ncbi:hypothetical protein [Tunturiibacter lichenicola]|uniref:hypothetical protein n=1 Tax=Tunturiibacter lichenicola TaxID=2051959 RepID=UPI003D9B17B6
MSLIMWYLARQIFRRLNQRIDPAAQIRVGIRTRMRAVAHNSDFRALARDSPPGEGKRKLMTKLPNINFARLETVVAAITPLFEDCSRYIGPHSQPMETLNVRPSLSTLKADWKKLQKVKQITY